MIVEAEIVNCELSWLHSYYGNWLEGLPPESDYIAEYVYEVKGVWYRRGMHISDPERVGERFAIEYDPDNPIRNSAPGKPLTSKIQEVGRSWFLEDFLLGYSFLRSVSTHN